MALPEDQRDPAEMTDAERRQRARMTLWIYAVAFIGVAVALFIDRCS